MEYFTLYPIYLIDIAGSALAILFTIAAFVLAMSLLRRERENIFWIYLVWLSGALSVFAFSRGIGHILQYVFVFTGRSYLWNAMAPVSGSLNTLSFVFAGTVSLFMIEMSNIYQKMSVDKKTVERLNSELASLNSELESIASERSLNLMALRVADKVRNPASVIGAIARRLIESPEMPQGSKKKLGDILEASARLDFIVKDYDEILKTKDKFFHLENLNEIIKEILLTFEPQAREKKIELSVELSRTSPVFYAVKHLIRMAFLHLLRNALDVSPRGGKVVIRTGKTDKRVFVSVTDKGEGIRAEDLERIFDLFYSTKGRIGTGLPIVKQIVEEHGGEINVESIRKKGSTFFLYFPAGWLEFAESPSKKGRGPGEPSPEGLH